MTSKNNNQKASIRNKSGNSEVKVLEETGQEKSVISEAKVLEETGQEKSVISEAKVLITNALRSSIAIWQSGA